MSECIDKRFERMLHAWELGMLDSEQQAEMDTHLLECDHCFAKAQRMADASELLRGSERVKQVVVASGRPTEKDVNSQKPQWTLAIRRWWPRLVPVAAVIFLLLLLKDWRVEFSPSDEVRAESDRLVIVPFENAADPSDSIGLAMIASHLLSTDLAESEYIRIISSRRLTDQMHFEGFESDSALSPEQITRLAGEVGARWMLTGRILQQSPRIIIGTELSEVRTGTVLGSQTVTGIEGESIFELVDQLTVKIKTALALPIEALREDDPRVADVTTHSAQAYRYYLQGLNYYEKYYVDEARRSFETAVSFDSTFAMAYYWLARLASADYLERAVLYSKYATEKERGYILSLQDIANQNYQGAIDRLQQVVDKYPDEKEAYFWLGRYYFILGQNDSALANFQRVIAIDPLHKQSFNQLAYVYKAMGNLDLALEAIDRYIELAPNEANPLDSRGEILAESGRLDEAIESYSRALEIKPDFYSSWNRLGILYIFKGDYDRADSCFTVLASAPNRVQRSSGRLFLAYRPIHQGKVFLALQRLDEALTGDRIENISWSSRMLAVVLKMHLLAETGHLEEALEVLQEGRSELIAATSPDNLNYRLYVVELLLALDRPEAARAQIDTLKSGLDDHRAGSSYYWHAAAMMARYQGNLDSAINLFEHGLEVVDVPPTRIRLAETLEAASQPDSAIAILETYLAKYTSLRAYWGVWDVSVHYRLGRLYEDSGRLEEAAQQYSVFLELWQDADSFRPEIDDASQRLRRLQSRP